MARAKRQLNPTTYTANNTTTNIQLTTISQVEEKVNLLFEMLVKTMKTVEEIKDSMAHTEAIQAAKDDAQDEVMQMEFDSYDRKLANVLKYKDLSEAMAMMDAQMKSLEAGVNRKVLDSTRSLNSSVDHELEKVR